MQGTCFDQRAFSLLAGGDIAQNRGKVALATQPHFTRGDLERKAAAVLAAADHFAAQATGQGDQLGRELLARPLALVGLEFGNEPAEVLAAQLRGRIAKHQFDGRVDGFDDPAGGMEGDDAVHHGVEDGLDEFGTIAQGLLHGIFLGDIAKHQHRPDHLAVAVADRRATVGNITLAAIAANDYRVVGQPLNRAMRQGIHDRDGGGHPGGLVDNLKHLAHLPADGLRLGPAGEVFRHRVEHRHARAGIRGQHRIADRTEGHGELFLALAQGAVGLLKPGVGLLLDL